MSRTPLDLTGQTFGRLTALKLVPGRRGKCRNRRWYAKCSCGNTIRAYQTNLTSGRTKSCGCLQRERVTTHGLSHSSAYKTWAYLQQSKAPICKHWQKFDHFLADLGEKPQGHRLSRHRGDRPHKPSNTYWRPTGISSTLSLNPEALARAHA